MSEITGAADLISRLHSFPWAAWREELGADYRPLYEDGLTKSAEDAADAAGILFDVDDPFTSHFITQYVGERMSQLEQTTKDDVTRIIRNRFDDPGDKSIATLRDEVLERVRDKFDSYEEYRAERIARTETAITFNHGTALAAAQGEFDLDVIDGDDDEECAAANGEVWSAEEALADPISHPNCTRDFSPHLEEDGEDVEAFQWVLYSALQQAQLREAA